LLSCSLPLPHPPPSTLFPYTTLFRSRTVSVAIAPAQPHGRQDGRLSRRLARPEGLMIIEAAGIVSCQALPPRTSSFAVTPAHHRSEEHTSELQSRGHLVCRLLLEKKK